MPKLNEIIHQPVRLRIMAALVTLGPDEEVDFSYLRKLLEVTDGNLGHTCANWKSLGTSRSINSLSSASRAPSSLQAPKVARSSRSM
jgi:hypothetical protein